MQGGYEDGYRSCSCFWGEGPGSLIAVLESEGIDFRGMSVLDAGCGEGKNAIYLAQKGANVLAIDISETAIGNAKAIKNLPQGIHWENSDVQKMLFKNEEFDLVVAYGLLHCLSNKEQILSLVSKFIAATKCGGYIILCAFNNRSQDLSAHPGFTPTCLSHADYLSMVSGLKPIFTSDKDLTEVHPNNNIVHTHSMTRIIAQKI